MSNAMITRNSTTSNPDWQVHPLEVLRKKWGTVPSGGASRRSTQDLMALNNEDLLTTWSDIVKADTTGKNWSHRGWYHTLYQPILKNQRIIDLGSGMGIDGITFAKAGARVTFIDIVRENLQLIERICKLYQVNQVKFLWLDTIDAINTLDKNYDVLWAQGSLHHAPREFIQQEVALLLEHLKSDARWIQLAYPRKRWQREGALSFEQWGEVTDGPGTPWAEWYDLNKILENLAPAQFETILNLEIRNAEFNWFDLRRID